MLHLPLWRAGKTYRSLSVEPLTDIRTGEVIGEVSQASAGLISRDQKSHSAENQAALERCTVAELLGICHRAADLFMTAELPLGNSAQTPDQYLDQLAATAGMPVAMGRRNMEKIHGVLSRLEDVLAGLTRGLDLSVLDGGFGSVEGSWGDADRHELSYVRQTDALGGVLPNNSPGVHNLWLPAIPLKVPLVLKPGSAEPWTPYRLAAAWVAAGCPPEAWSLYPTSHAGANEILLRTGRSMFFGDASTVARWQNRGGIQVHGPGWSKVVFGHDTAADWASHLDLLVDSIAANGGRSCINASGVWTPTHGRELAAALAERLAAIEARPLDDPDARLAAFPNPEVARRISALVDSHLAAGGAEDLTARYRSGDRVAETGGATFLLPTVIYTEDPDHPLARSEFVFPFATVVETKDLFETLGPTLIASVITGDEKLVAEALRSRSIDRLNLGPVPTYHISWDQPHEGNLFDHLYQQRAFQRTALAS